MLNCLTREALQHKLNRPFAVPLRRDFLIVVLLLSFVHEGFLDSIMSVSAKNLYKCMC